MALIGKLIKLDGGIYGLECEFPHHDKPRKAIQVWPVTSWRIRGMMGYQPDEAIGKAASCTDGRVSVYLGDGTYFDGVLPDGGSTKSISCVDVDIPCPKVRAGVETRWNGSKACWQKYSKAKGWIAA